MKKLKKIFLCIFMFLSSFTMFGCASVNLDVIYAQKQDSYGAKMSKEFGLEKYLMNFYELMNKIKIGE